MTEFDSGRDSGLVFSLFSKWRKGWGREDLVDVEDFVSDVMKIENFECWGEMDFGYDVRMLPLTCRKHVKLSLNNGL